MSKKPKKAKVQPITLELKSVLEEIQNLAKEIVNDYTKNPSQISGSMIQIHSEASILNTDSEKKLKN